jgi:signal transduction histidine kinase/CheY-like chemotaxis protein
MTAMPIPRWALPPQHGNDEDALKARVAHWFLLTAIATLAVLLATWPFYERDPYTLPVFGTSMLAALASFVLLHRGYLRASALLVCAISWAIVMVVSIASGGVRSPQLATTVLVVMLIGFLWSSRAALIAAGVTSLSILVLIVAEERGALPPVGPKPAPAAVWGAITSVLVIASAFLHLALRAIQDSRRALAEKSRELEEEMRRRGEAEESLRRAQKLEALGLLTGGIAHDFNNLLTVVMGQSAILAERAAAREQLNDDAAEEIRDIRLSTERAAALTRRLLHFARPQSGTPEDVDPGTALERLAPVLRRVIPENIHLEIRPPEHPLIVHIDPAQLEQVILNLVLNARDAMCEGGRLRIQCSEVDIDDDAARRADARSGLHLAMSVSDTGPGVPLEDQGRIFDPFFTTKGLGHGTGLGLSTVHGIVRQAGGYVALESEPGHGATLTVRLPARAAASPLRLPPEERARSALGATDAVILLCEDEEPVRRLLAATLEAAGYCVLSAPVPERALALARARPDGIDMLVSDVVMPGMSGLELANALRAERKRLPVLLVTGYATADIDLPRGGGATTDVLEKPFAADALLDRVARLLEAAGRTAAA